MHSLHINFDSDIDELTDGIWEVDYTVNKFYFSPKFSKTLGYSPGELDST